MMSAPTASIRPLALFMATIGVTVGLTACGPKPKGSFSEDDPRSAVNQLLRATVGMALGFAYFVADNFSLAMGNVGAYPPIMAAWAPFVLFLLIGETVLIRSEE